MEDRYTSNHNPPDNINFYFKKFNGKNRQVWKMEQAPSTIIKKLTDTKIANKRRTT